MMARNLAVRLEKLEEGTGGGDDAGAFYSASVATLSRPAAIIRLAEIGLAAEPGASS